MNEMEHTNTQTYEPGVPVDALEHLLLDAVLGKIFQEMRPHLVRGDALLGKCREVRLEPRLHCRSSANEALEVEQEERA